MEAKMQLWLVAVVATCSWGNSMSSHFPTLLRSVVNETAGAYRVAGSSSQIRGPNGYCLDVRGGDYDKGAVILWFCKDDPPAHQLWTFESDGTIRSNGLCLTTGTNRGSAVVMYSCKRLREEYTKWEMRDSGLIVHQKTSFVLTAISGTLETLLSLERNMFSSFQTWASSNSDPTKSVYIVGMDARCLQEQYGAVLAEKCDGGVAGQWYLYPDGTIRSSQDSYGCLSYDYFTDRRAIFLSCGMEPSSERWVFTSNHTILNQRANLVLEMRKPDQIVVAEATGLPNQRWKKLPT